MKADTAEIRMMWVAVALCSATAVAQAQPQRETIPESIAKGAVSMVGFAPS
jgi:hypothetical protein